MTGIKIEAGKCYRLRNDEMVGPLYQIVSRGVWRERAGQGRWWFADGGYSVENKKHDYDIVEVLEKPKVIQLTDAEIQSGRDRVMWAEDLIRQLPENHDGRNSWLLNYGRTA